MDPQPRGPDWMQITPKAGSLFHAYSHFTAQSMPRALGSNRALRITSWFSRRGPGAPCRPTSFVSASGQERRRTRAGLRKRRSPERWRPSPRPSPGPSREWSSVGAPFRRLEPSRRWFDRCTRFPDPEHAVGIDCGRPLPGQRRYVAHRQRRSAADRLDTVVDPVKRHSLPLASKRRESLRKCREAQIVTEPKAVISQPLA